MTPFKLFIVLVCLWTVFLVRQSFCQPPSSIVPTTNNPSSITPSNSISDPNNLQQQLQQSEEAEEAYRAELRRLQEQTRQVATQLTQQQRVTRVIHNLQTNTPSAPQIHAPTDSQCGKYEPVPDPVRGLIAENVCHEGGMSYEKAAATFHVSRSTVGRIVREEKDKQLGVPPQIKKKRGRKSNLTIEAIIFLLLLLEEDSTITLKEMERRLEEKGIPTSITALQKAFSRMEVTWKNTLPIPYDWNTYEVIAARQEYLGKIGMVTGRPLVYIDESGFHMHIKKSKGRALAGEKATLSLVPKGSRISLIAALSELGYPHYQLFNDLGDKKRGVRAEDFRSFLLDLAPKIPRNAVILLDNAKIHHAELLVPTFQMLKQTYGIDHIFLPPYSPFLNPIELSFNSIKMCVSSKTFFNRGDLIRAIEEAIVETVTSEHAKQWFEHSHKYHAQCALGLPFTGKICDPDFIQNLPSSSSTTTTTTIPTTSPFSLFPFPSITTTTTFTTTTTSATTSSTTLAANETLPALPLPPRSTIIAPSLASIPAISSLSPSQ
eukprot:TRINITY_DN912_c0_g1_i1.p1 TRINITY_DN912_c0_g1~~TRINITY_DN912_c0_g1_i1.p1  ORF type:complete len:547 (+),score=142.39 TRINITY_DN912_c0_g1_i1:136-1776(+)